MRRDHTAMSVVEGVSLAYVWGKGIPGQRFRSTEFPRLPRMHASQAGPSVAMSESALSSGLSKKSFSSS